MGTARCLAVARFSLLAPARKLRHTLTTDRRHDLTLLHMTDDAEGDNIPLRLQE